ncbi:GNAT family N-acetyltransferase [Agromyces aurantiacus]|uniref:GNAT family N-acetyltransferase n=1 Tax=Agromyces aurantiacus TaxID=165814 RepID=A0ABV9R4L4_9MICO|nr:GNAT family N-acetyltransferase [Agromyces aurantiacus]MBM7503239.1 GNAT superfamily N-acetyltransferase [Agromyces aurantiacus]
MPRPELVIRTTREDDWAAVRDLRLEMLRDTPIAFGDTLERALTYDEAEWRTRARRGESSQQTVVVAIRDDEWVGTMACYVPDLATGPMLVGVYVAPGHRGEEAGITRALLAEIECWAAERSDTLRLEVHEDNPRARRFYEKLGFTYTGASRPYELEPGGLELEMAKRVR